jgi:hypothetical protein
VYNSANFFKCLIDKHLAISFFAMWSYHLTASSIEWGNSTLFLNELKPFSKADIVDTRAYLSLYKCRISELSPKISVLFRTGKIDKTANCSFVEIKLLRFSYPFFFIVWCPTFCFRAYEDSVFIIFNRTLWTGYQIVTVLTSSVVQGSTTDKLFFSNGLIVILPWHFCKEKLWSLQPRKINAVEFPVALVVLKLDRRSAIYIVF